MRPSGPRRNRCGAKENQIDVRMYEPWDKEVHALIDDYEEDFGVRMSFEDARQILIHYEELIELFEKYGGTGYEVAGFLES
jgi:hypothetical protein